MRKFAFIVIPIWVSIVSIFFSPVFAAIYNVNSFSDTVDASPGNTTCADVNGQCSLRAAIMELNSSGTGSNMINLPEGTYSISLAGTGENFGATGDLDIEVDVEISGQGTYPSDTVIDFNDIDKGIHVLGNVANIVDVEMNNLRLTDSIGGAGDDGAAFALEYTNLILDEVEIDNHTKTAGGSATFGGFESQVYLTNTNINNQLGGDGVIASIINGAFRAENSTFFNLSSATAGSSLINLNGCATRGTELIITCEVNFLRSTIASTTTATFFDNIVGMNGLGCGNIIHNNAVTGAAVCTLNDVGATEGYNTYTNAAPSNLCLEAGLNDQSSGSVNLGSNLDEAVTTYAKNVGGLNYLKIGSSSIAVDSVPVGTCGCTSGDAVDGNDDDTAACDAGAYEYLPSAQIEGYVWIDTNGDGIQSGSTEIGLNGVAVDVFVDADNDGDAEPDEDDGGFVDSIDTENDTNSDPGYFLFEDLDPGSYFLVINLPDDYEFTDENAGSDDAIDSDADDLGISNVFSISPQGTISDFGVGIVPGDGASGTGTDDSASPTPTPESSSLVSTSSESGNADSSGTTGNNGNQAGANGNQLSQTGMSSLFFYIIGTMTTIVGALFTLVGRRYI